MFRSRRSDFLAVLFLAVLAAWPDWGAEGAKPDASSSSAVLERFIVNQAEVPGWPLETMEIEASLPKLHQTGRLRAIRRLVPWGHPDYEVLEIAGDATVKKQVIARYISADERAADLPVSTVAITPANYRIHYTGTVPDGDGLAYTFRVVPRKKREGLINGALWLDSATGVIVRESGYLAKSPSIFLKRVSVTRDNELHNGTIAARITHVSIETRLVGRAELVIVERPAADEMAARSAASEGQ